MSDARKGLFNYIVIGVLISALATVYVFYATPLISEAEQVNRRTVEVEFERTVMLARAQWLKTKSSVVRIYETQLLNTGKVAQNKSGALELLINSNGWPEGMDKAEDAACEQLYRLSSSTTAANSELTITAQRDRQGFLECRYVIDDILWFMYTAKNGVIHKN
ncbi:hypothetical protein Q4561_06450 [Alteromonas sp. 1_MG-2023]|uniref:hypothetical protein n=1 Tax=Alteromonas sp. 1_MG-2023 TaxID=3062669 RepID=UPI0026E46482|nr:hypothetical protein [Alteromonas sp. 1_MG-2023]MDO6566693.1 hypothetical protein [Alteromonas sp. 1_MG-2023]